MEFRRVLFRSDARSRATRKDPALTGSARRQPRGAGASRRRACGFLAAMELLQRGNDFLGLVDAGEQDGVPGFDVALADQVIEVDRAAPERPPHQHHWNRRHFPRSEEHPSALQSLMSISYAVTFM